MAFDAFHSTNLSVSLYSLVDAALAKTEKSDRLRRSGATGWILRTRAGGRGKDRPLRYAWPCVISGGGSAPSARYVLLGDKSAGEAAITDDDVFIHWGGACEPLLRVAGAISASLMSEAYVSMFLRALRKGDRNVAGAADPAPQAPTPFDVVWFWEEHARPWPAVLIPCEAAQLLCADYAMRDCAAKKNAVIIYLGDPPMKTLQLDYPPIASLDGWKFGLNGPEDQRTAESARGAIERAADKKWDVASFNVAFRCATRLRQGMREVLGPAIAQQSFIKSATITAACLSSGPVVDDSDADTDTVVGDISDSEDVGRGAGGAAAGSGRKPNSKKAAGLPPPEVGDDASGAGSPAGMRAGGGAASSSGSKRRRNAARPLSPPPSASAPDVEPSPGMAEIERQLEVLEQQRAQLLRARGELEAKVRAELLDVATITSLPSTPKLQERRAAAAVATSQLRDTQASIEQQRALVDDAENAAALARERAEREFALASAKRDEALTRAARALSSARAVTSAELTRLRTVLAEQEKAVAAFSDVLPRAALGAGGVAEGGGPGATPPGHVASARATRAAGSS